MNVQQKNWTDIIKPNGLATEFGSDPDRRATIIVQPLERGFGLTLGNALRRVLLSRPEQFVETVAEKLLMYATGRGLEYYDRPAVRAIAREAAADGNQLSALVLGIVRSTPFQMRRSAAQVPGED